MASWLNHSWSLNKTNKKKLTHQIQKFEQSIMSLEERLLKLLSEVHDWRNYAKSLTELSHQQRLSAKHILQLRPLLQQSEDFHKILDVLSTNANTSLSHVSGPSEK